MQMVELVLVGAMILVVAFMIWAILRKAFSVAARIFFGFLSVFSIVLFLVVSDSGRVSNSLSVEDKVFVLMDGNVTITGFNVSGGRVVLWREGEIPDALTAKWVLSFSIDSFDSVKTVSLFGVDVDAVFAEDVVLSDDVVGSLASGSSKLGLPSGLAWDVSVVRSTLFALLVKEVLDGEDAFDLIRSEKVVVSPDAVTFKFIRYVPRVLVPFVKPFVGLEFSSDGSDG